MINEARTTLEDAATVTILTGAGVSTDSGVPDFRGPDGLWTKHPEMERLSDISHFMNDPEVRQKTWEIHVLGRSSNIEPNASHHLLADYQNNSGKVDQLVTQNVAIWRDSLAVSRATRCSQHTADRHRFDDASRRPTTPDPHGANR